MQQGVMDAAPLDAPVRRRTERVAPVPMLVTDLDRATFDNRDFRRVLWTTARAQLVLMSLPVGARLATELHEAGDQFLKFESGVAEVIVDGRALMLSGGESIHVPAGGRHSVRNASSTRSLQLYTLYTPPVHPPGTVQRVQPVEGRE